MLMLKPLLRALIGDTVLARVLQSLAEYGYKLDILIARDTGILYSTLTKKQGSLN